jgi:hypothetical protein
MTPLEHVRRPGIDLAPPPPTALEASARAVDGSLPGVPVRRSRRGRPLEMAPEIVLERIRNLAQREEGLFRVHRTHGALYARARRQFGAWSRAVELAGIDYVATIDRARQRSLRGRRLRSRRRPVQPAQPA